MEKDKVPRLLLVEDDAAIRQTLAEFLLMEGYVVSTATDGEQAFQKVTDFGPDLVISDILMPVCDGFQLARRLSALPAPVPFLLMSGFGGEGDLGPLRDNPSFAGFVSKPILIEDLLERISACLDRLKSANPGSTGG